MVDLIIPCWFASPWIPTLFHRAWGDARGSGLAEAVYENLTQRLKHTGMKWDQDHAAGMTNVVALLEIGHWDQY